MAMLKVVLTQEILPVLPGLQVIPYIRSNTLGLP